MGVVHIHGPGSQCGPAIALFGGHPRVEKFFNDLTIDGNGSLYVGTLNGDAANAGRRNRHPATPTASVPEALQPCFVGRNPGQPSRL
jgi:hypothetical protein